MPGANPPVEPDTITPCSLATFAKDHFSYVMEAPVEFAWKWTQSTREEMNQLQQLQYWQFHAKYPVWVIVTSLMHTIGFILFNVIALRGWGLACIIAASFLSPYGQITVFIHTIVGVAFIAYVVLDIMIILCISIQHTFSWLCGTAPPRDLASESLSRLTESEVF